jgi:rare lipoprotein A (peptidoglycan hydrolase)
MHSRFKTARVVLALVAGLSLPTLTVAAALASTGGASAPTPTTPTTAPSAASSAAVHPWGIATWFGPGFYGHKTACGQTLTPAVVGVANRTLPCGTLIRVAYHGHAITVPVLDRGPYANHADWDLTAGAAKALGVTETVRIHTRVIGTAPNTPSLGSPPETAEAPAASAAGGTAAAG